MHPGSHIEKRPRSCLLVFSLLRFTAGFLSLMLNETVGPSCANIYIFVAFWAFDGERRVVLSLLLLLIAFRLTDRDE
jgi:hypothetical protein